MRYFIVSILSLLFIFTASTWVSGGQYKHRAGEETPIKILPGGRIVDDTQAQNKRNIPGWERARIKKQCALNREVCRQDCKLNNRGDFCPSKCQSKYEACMSVLYE
jgi:hypothetical protein